ncbi:unnamed protein product [Clonostachys byssicola]|uniref:Uncharacterized protein n=1 Tax=Clonostachys byssicola TaxID=160290 RepID=A0A9N9Y061_9HYPO|nr:unnamed protein product [Clonostachys byssicola]
MSRVLVENCPGHGVAALALVTLKKGVLISGHGARHLVLSKGRGEFAVAAGAGDTLDETLNVALVQGILLAHLDGPRHLVFSEGRWDLAVAAGARDALGERAASLISHSPLGSRARTSEGGLDVTALHVGQVTLRRGGSGQASETEEGDRKVSDSDHFGGY